MKKFCLLLVFVLMISCTLVSCGNAEAKDEKAKKNEIVDAEETPELLLAQKVINGLYGEDSYRYEEIENEPLTVIEEEWPWYDELTFYQVYKDNKEFCKIFVHTTRLEIGVKTPEKDTYRRVKFNANGAYLTDKDV